MKILFILIILFLISCGKEETINKTYSINTSIISCNGYINYYGKITPYLNKAKYEFSIKRVDINDLIIFSGCIKSNKKSYCNTIETYDDSHDWLRIPIGIKSYDYAMTVNEEVLKISIYNRTESIFIEATPLDYCKFN